MSRWIKAALVGLATGIVCGVLAVIIQVGIAAIRLSFMARAAAESGSGGIGAVSETIYAPLVAVIGFVGGFIWHLRRRKKG